MGNKNWSEEIKQYYEKSVSKQYQRLSKSNPITIHSDYRESWYTLQWEPADGVDFEGVVKETVGNTIRIFLNGELTDLNEADLKTVLAHLAVYPSQHPWD